MPPTAGGELSIRLLDRMMERLGQRVAISSAPGLAAALRQSHRWVELPAPMRRLLQGDPLVQMYRIPSGSVAEEAQAAAHVLLAVADRLRRLSSAYGEWRHFDASAYFDLSEPQTARLVRVVERVTTVHVTFFADLLLPSFQTAELFWQEEYWPQYRALRTHLRSGDAPLAPVMTFADHRQPQMVGHWTRLVQVMQKARRLLSEELAFWAANGGDDERARWQRAWQHDPAPGVVEALLPALEEVPTLTLAVDFPLPPGRQPGRLRRLRSSQTRRQRGTWRPRSW